MTASMSPGCTGGPTAILRAPRMCAEIGAGTADDVAPDSLGGGACDSTGEASIKAPAPKSARLTAGERNFMVL